MNDAQLAMSVSTRAAVLRVFMVSPIGVLSVREP
jgi:hypothetical protein